jgi:beta-lactamase regulating signal transducer with metallopeptidase domain
MRYVPALIQHLWISTLFLALVLAVVFAMRSRLTASARFTLALIGIAKFAIPAGAISLFGRSATQVITLPVQAMSVLSPEISAPPAPAIWPQVVLGIWAAIAAIITIRFTLTRHRLVRLAVKTALPASPREIAALARARARARVTRSIDIARSSVSEAPAVLRTVRPLVVLPSSGCDELSDAELEALLCHECAHVRRHDNLVARLESFICALFWFHPLIWIAQRITVIERERACDEAVADSADERKTYLTALAKFCHAAIVPRLPGVSCMATSRLKERMDHVENYETLKSQAPSPRRIAAIGFAALVAYTLFAGMTGSNRLLAIAKLDGEDAYAIKLTATRKGDVIQLTGRVTENATQKVLANPTVRFPAGGDAETITSCEDGEIRLRVRPGSTTGPVTVDVFVDRKGQRVVDTTLSIAPSAAGPEPPKYTGRPITMDLKDAGLKDVLTTFGKLTGNDVQVDDSVTGTISVSWRNVPWDQAFEEIINENGLKYRIEGNTIHVTKR